MIKKYLKWLVVGTMVALTACTSPKEILYLQDVDPIKEQQIEQKYEVIIHSDDMLSIMSPPPDLMEILYSLTLKGYTPIIAHPERYVYMTSKDYERLKAKGYRFQLNYLSLAGFYGKPAYIKAHELLKKQMYDYTGSDCHNLDKHRWGLAHLELTNSEIEMLSKLLANNKLLF